MKQIKKHVHLLHILSKASPQQRKAILNTASTDQLKSICEICQNLLHGNIPGVKVRKLAPYKKVFRKLADKKIGLSSKRKLLTQQTGGFLSVFKTLLPSVLKLLTGDV